MKCVEDWKRGKKTRMKTKRRMSVEMEAGTEEKKMTKIRSPSVYYRYFHTNTALETMHNFAVLKAARQETCVVA